VIDNSKTACNETCLEGGAWWVDPGGRGIKNKIAIIFFNLLGVDEAFRNLLVPVLSNLCQLGSIKKARVFVQGTLTEGEGSVQFASSLR
jgi:hypothetical protein